MRKELEDQLFKKYPKIFKQKDLPCTETCMCWGLECGDGWFDIIDTLCSKIQNHIDTTGKSQVEAVQVKEKYGTLRFYTDTCDDEIDKYITEAENQTQHICQLCGSSDGVKATRGWISYLCVTCSKTN